MGIKAASAGTLEIELLVDLARLKRDMDAAANTVGGGTGQIVARVDNANRALGRMGGGIAGVGKSAKLQSHHLTNLTFQLNDVATMAAMGASPMRIFASQAGQIFQISQQAGLGLLGFAKAIGMLLLPWTPLIAVMGAGFLIFRDFQQQAEKSAGLKEYAKSLGLTQKEMKKLGDVSVTAGDVMSGAWTTLKEALNLKPALDGAGRLLQQATVYAKNLFVGIGAAIYGLFVGGYRAVIQTWRLFPAALGDLFVQGVNLAIRSIEWLLKKGIDTVNALSNAAGFGNLLSPSSAQLGRMSNDWAGAAAKVGNVFVKEMTGAVNEFIAGAGKLGDRLISNIGDAAQDRMRKRAQEIIADRTDKAPKKPSQEAENAARKWWNDYWQFLHKGTNKIAEEMQEAFDRAAESGYEAMQRDLDDRQDAAAEQRERKLEDQRRRFLDTAYDFADIVGGGLAQAIRSLLPMMDRARDVFGKGSAIEKLAMSGSIGSIAASATGGNGLAGSSGGMLGGKLGEKFLSKGLESMLPSLGQFAGPIGAIAGGVLGGVVGGMLKKTKKASATIEIMAGDAMTASIAGNSAKLKAVAGGMADSLIKGLTDIAEQLGGELGGGIKLSIGQRKKKFVVDPTGMGRTKGAGTLSFDSEAEAIAAATANVIRQGALTGLRAGTDALVKGTGDLQAQIQKAMSFEGVFKELKQRTDPVGYALEEIAREFDKLEGVFKEAGASAEDYAQLQQLRTLKETEAKAQAEKAAEDISERLGLERQLLEAQKDTTALRRLDLEALLPANRALQKRIWALEEETAAAEQAAAKVQAIATERTGLEQRLAVLVEGTAASRRFELAALDESNRAILERIYAIEDERAALDAAAEAAADAARIAADAAAAAQAQLDAIASERRSLSRELLEVNGDTASLLAMDREAIDPANRALFDLIQTRKAEIAAAEAAQRAAEEQQRQADDAARAAEQLADAWRSVAESIMEEVRRIRGMSASEALSFAELQGRFNAASIAARAGDQDAAKGLPGLSKDLLEAAERVATSRQELERVQAATATSLEQTAQLIGALTGTGQSLGFGVPSANDNGGMPSWWADAAAASAGAGASLNGALIEEVRGVRAELSEVKAELRTQTGLQRRSTDVLENVTEETGGRAIITQAAA